jgi:hypothetical protein
MVALHDLVEARQAGVVGGDVAGDEHGLDRVAGVEGGDKFKGGDALGGDLFGRGVRGNGEDAVDGVEEDRASGGVEEVEGGWGGCLGHGGVLLSVAVVGT